MVINGLTKGIYNAFTPRRTCNTTLEGLKKDAAFFCVTAHRHLLVTHLNTSPTAIGIISGESGLPFFKAVRFPPARYFKMEEGALPEARRVTTPRSRELIDDGNWIPAASMRCCIRNPDGPAVVSLGKDRRIPMMLKLGGKMGSSVIGGVGEATGGGLLGCLATSNLQVSSLLVAIPDDVRV